MISLHKHLTEEGKQNKYLQLVLHHEEDKLVRVSNEFRTVLHVKEDSRNICKEAKYEIKKNHKEEYQRKDQQTNK